MSCAKDKLSPRERMIDRCIKIAAQYGMGHIAEICLLPNAEKVKLGIASQSPQLYKQMKELSRVETIIRRGGRFGSIRPGARKVINDLWIKVAERMANFQKEDEDAGEEAPKSAEEFIHEAIQQIGQDSLGVDNSEPAETEEFNCVWPANVVKAGKVNAKTNRQSLSLTFHEFEDVVYRGSLHVGDIPLNSDDTVVVRCELDHDKLTFKKGEILGDVER